MNSRLRFALGEVKALLKFQSFFWGFMLVGCEITNRLLYQSNDLTRVLLGLILVLLGTGALGAMTQKFKHRTTKKSY